MAATKHKLHTLLHDVSSDDYHGCRHSWSSSQIKDINKNEKYFHKKYILREIEKKHIPAFDTGNYFHTGILEPHLLKKVCAIYPGSKKFGARWDDFKEKNAGKTIISGKQIQEVDNLIRGVKKCPVSMGRLRNIKPEVSLFVEIHIHAGEIYAPFYKKRLTRDGWVKHESKIHKDAVRLVVKVRADGLASTYVVDLKSMSGDPEDAETIETTISNLVYDLSASLYLDLFTLEMPEMREFIWIFASKDQGVAQCWKSDRENVLIGRIKWSKGILKLAANIRAGWKFEPYMGEIGPAYWERKHLKETDTDLL